MNKTVIIILLLGALGSAAVGGGIWWYMTSQSGSPVPQPPTTDQFPLPTAAAIPSVIIPTEAMEASGQTVEFTVETKGMKFVPNVLKVKKGDTVKITFKNTSGFHDFVIDEFEVQTNQIGEGDEEEVEFVADKVGTFDYYCSVSNHRKQGMVGKLIVE